jgi:protein-L-isoaspartate(D-aspartate) O-methyltransferase
MGEPDWAKARAQMVAGQLERRGVREPRVLDAMRHVPRHLFVPPDQRAGAYEDRALPIGNGQTISQPYMVAIMSAALGSVTGARVLEVGTGSGYQAAVLAELAAEVITIERRPELGETARQTLASLGCTNITVIVGDGSLGHPACAHMRASCHRRRPGAASLKDATGGGARGSSYPVGSHEHQHLLVIERRYTFVGSGRGVRVRSAHRMRRVAGPVGPNRRGKSVLALQIRPPALQLSV